MAEYIGKAVALKRFEEIKSSGVSLKDAVYLDGVMAVIDSLPSVDVEPVVHGAWVKEPVEFWSVPDYKCSICGCYAIEDSKGKQSLSNYCPNCGAKMDMEEGQ